MLFRSFGYTDTSNDPRVFDADDHILKSYEGPLPGINPLVMMGTYPHAWADWLRQQGQEVPDSVLDLYFQKVAGTEYESGGSVPLALKWPAELHDTYFMVEKTIEYLSEQSSSWCVHLSLLRPHPPWVAPEPFNSLYPPETLMDFKRQPDIETESSQHPFLAHYLGRRGHSATTDDRRTARLKASYFGLMSEVDQNLGRLFEYLRATGQWDNTLIIFTSDHGEIGRAHV